MSGNHSHSSTIDKNLKIGLFLNTAFTVFEFIVGVASGSLALMSDAAHNLTDSLSILISYGAHKISKKEANSEKTYGYGRATILAAMLNTFILFILAFYIFYEAYQRLLYPQPVQGGKVAIVAFIGILINGSIAWIFSKNKNDLNIRSAFLSMVFDTLASVGAVIAGVVILLTGNTLADPLISVLIGIMLCFSAWGVAGDALHILLDGVPKGIDLKKVEQAMRKIAGVEEVHDLHIWSLSSQEAALSCHIIMQPDNAKEQMRIVANVKRCLVDRFHIEHSTIEVQLNNGRHENECSRIA